MTDWTIEPTATTTSWSNSTQQIGNTEFGADVEFGADILFGGVPETTDWNSATDISTVWTPV